MAEALVTPAAVTIKTVKGDTAPFSITVNEDDVAVDFTGSSMRLQLRYPNSNNVAVTLTSSSGITLGASGVATIDTTTVNALEVGDYKYDVQWTNASNVKRTIINGTWSVLYEATTD